MAKKPKHVRIEIDVDSDEKAEVLAAILKTMKKASDEDFAKHISNEKK